MTITIINWDKFNPRKDVKVSSWFRMEHSIWFDPDWEHFSGEEFAVWTYLLSLASFKNKNCFRYNPLTVSRNARVSEKSVKSAVEKLKELQCVQITSDDAYADVTCTLRKRIATDGRTDETDITDETVHSPADADVHDRKQIVPTITKPTTQVWEFYRQAYLNRYGVDPVRNAAVNGQLNQLVKRLGESEAPEVASFYVTHNNQYYVKSMHAVGPMLKDAEKLRTEWFTGRKITNHEASDLDRRQTNVNAFQVLLDREQKRAVGK